jgi:hypothetical protein
MTGVKLRDSERWKHRRKPTPIEDAAPAPAVEAVPTPQRDTGRNCDDRSMGREPDRQLVVQQLLRLP